MKWNVYNAKDSWLGIVEAADEAAALAAAKLLDPDAAKVEARAEGSREIRER